MTRWDSFKTMIFGERNITKENFEDDDIWTGGFGSASINEDQLLSIPSAYDAINSIVNPLKTLPLVFFERVSDKERKRISGDNIAKSLASPNAAQNGVEFFDFMSRNLLIYYNAFAEIISDNMGEITGYIPYHPDRVSILKTPTGFVYRINDDFGTRFISPEKMWHLKSGPFDRNGFMGKGPIITHQSTFSATLAVIDYGAKFFKNDGQPGGVLQVSGTLGAEAKENLRKSWQKAQSGGKQHRTAVLEDGTTYEEFTIENNKAQFIETRKADDIEIARIWNVPPHRIKSLEDATYSNIEQQAIEYVVHTLHPWLKLVEASIKSNLIGMDNNIFAEFNILGLLRGDIKARYEAYSKARNWGWFSVNDIRTLENLNPLEENGNIYLQPLNMVEAGTDPATLKGITVNNNQASFDDDDENTETDHKMLKLIEGKKDA